MLSRVSEKQMHRVRWLLTLGWLLLILSLFYDPLTPWLTNPTNIASPIRVDLTICTRVQGKCLGERPYAVGARIFWAAVVPAGIFILFVFGHEFWRRVCPLSFISQLPRAMGWQRRQLRENSDTGRTRTEIAKVSKNSWLAKNYLVLQLGLFFAGLCIRLLFVNSDRLALGIFLLITIAASIYVGYLFGGKAWCQYFCPMAPVQKIYSEPRGVLNSRAHEGDPQKITQSMCRTVNQTGEDKPACVACQQPCIDIDSERSYWALIARQDQRWLYYGYLGLTIGFYMYYYLYAGNWDYYFSGAWTHEEHQMSTLFSPGFFILGHAIPLPKLVAVPLTLGSFGFCSYWIAAQLEKRLKICLIEQKRPLSIELIRHRMFTLCTFLVFNVFFAFGARPNLRLFPVSVQHSFTMIIAIVSGIWLHRTWQRTPAIYQRERLTNQLRKKLRALNLKVGDFIEGQSLDELSADEVYVLAKVLPGFTHNRRIQVYRTILKESIEEGAMTPASSLELLAHMRRELEITDEEHDRSLADIGINRPDLLDPNRPKSREDWLRLESYRLVLSEVLIDRRRVAQGLGADLLAIAGDRKSLDSIEDLSIETLEKNLDEALSTESRKVVQQSQEVYRITTEEKEELMRSLSKRV